MVSMKHASGSFWLTSPRFQSLQFLLKLLSVFFDMEWWPPWSFGYNKYLNWNSHLLPSAGLSFFFVFVYLQIRPSSSFTHADEDAFSGYDIGKASHKCRIWWRQRIQRILRLDVTFNPCSSHCLSWAHIRLLTRTLMCGVHVSNAWSREAHEPSQLSSWWWTTCPCWCHWEHFLPCSSGSPMAISLMCLWCLNCLSLTLK
jgi:hypothetical protein